MSKGDKVEKKNNYFGKVAELCKTHKKIFIVTVDNVTSSQFHQVRHALRNQAVILMGKNTMIRKALRDVVSEVPEIESLIPWISGNIGLVFSNGDLKKVRELIVANKVAAPAKVGAIAQYSVSIPAGNTGISPDKTSFFQALNIPTKIVKGAVEIINEVQIIKEGEKVGASEAELLTMLKITPFSYGLNLIQVYEDGSLYEPSVLDISDDILLKRLSAGIQNVAALSMAVNYPTVASVPHSFIAAFKNVISVALGTDYSFPVAEEFKKALANAANAPAVKAAPVAAAAAPAKKEEKVVEKEESDDEMGFGLFD
jgi:large subunit ribosomal protein LP0